MHCCKLAWRSPRGLRGYAHSQRRHGRAQQIGQEHVTVCGRCKGTSGIDTAILHLPHQKGGKGGSKGKDLRERPSWPHAHERRDDKAPWGPSSYEMRPANRGRSEWTHWQDQIRAEASEGETRHSTWSQVSEPGADTSLQSWESGAQGPSAISFHVCLVCSWRSLCLASPIR